jgi:hypothetical protein
MKHIILILALFTIMMACQDLPPIPDPGEGCPACQVLLTIDKLVYSTSDTITVTLQNNNDTPVYLEGCNATYYAVKTDTGWQSITPKLCFWEGLAVKVGPGATFVDKYEAASFSGQYKFLANIYFECEDNKPISEAKCTSNARVESLPFVVVPK